MISYALVLILVSFAVTFTLRLTPFVLRSRLSDNQTLKDLASLMPVGIMVILVVYSFTSVMDDGLLAAIVGVIATAVLHLWKNQMLISIVGGVTFYAIALAIL